MRTLQLAEKTVPVIGQGTWRMGEDRQRRQAEIAALQLGIDIGLTLIDTAEMYGEGGAEQVVGEAIAGRRDQVTLVSKVYPHNASRHGIPAACERSLQRMKTDHIDLYLLHWPGSHPLDETVEAFERLREAGKIGRWGVSNFDVSDLLELETVDSPTACATNQVLYNPEQRGIEYDLLPRMQNAYMPLMAYCPIGQGGDLLMNPAILEVAKRHGATPAQISLAWVLRQDGVIAIPKAVDPHHLRSNAEAVNIELTLDDELLIDTSWPVPTRKRPLEMV
ncbi:MULTISPECIES: aldo/keto reductase [unclassified Pseudomonas]|uniref:aldo/keto reductase n=1 Tax=unclassified Pseudomonas TaxID=196821 RepID=UPI000D3373AE|nr:MULTISPECIES: aldo/keto reductase [unclassified Pseudomonas]RAU45125.1 aldo/keto reductase [Pseudomonas sp. RIT 409]RAU51425.1 aldo/keto reductase [Pseudomonas sp. RIT 412]